MKKVKSVWVGVSLASCFVFSSHVYAVDTTIKPSLTMQSASNIYYNNESQYELRGTTEPNGIIEVEMKDKKRNAISHMITADETGNYDTFLDTNELQNGRITLRAKTKGASKKEGAFVNKQIQKDDALYELDNKERKRWDIYSDGTHETETTNGFNTALKWAKEEKIKTFKVPNGTYKIQEKKPYDSESRINMVSDMTFLLDEEAILEKETNGREGYEILYLGPDVKNVTLKGGTYKGDKDTHDYTGKDFPYTAGTHEWGIGIMSAGAKDINIENVKLTNLTGDGLCLCGAGKQIAVLGETEFENGSINKNGILVEDSTKIRTKNIRTNFKNPYFQLSKMIHFSLPKGMSPETPFDIYFYTQDGTFLKAIKNQEINWSLIEVPNEADYYYAVFHTPSYKGVQIQYWNKPITERVVVKNSDISFNRRQGITIAGARDVKIENNTIHDTKGIAPQSGIDIEGGVGQNGHPNFDIQISNNKLYNNEMYDVILYDGEDVTVKNNELGPNDKKSSIGLAISSPFRKGARITDNTFEGSKIAVEGNSLFKGNTMKDSVASFDGYHTVIDGMTFIDSQVRLDSSTPFGIQMSNVTIYNNKKSNSGLVIQNQPVTLKNVTIIGESLMRNLSGNVADGSVFENLKVLGFSNYGIELPRGSYKNCVFEAAESNTAPIGSGRDGHFTLDNCSFKTKGRGLDIGNSQAVWDVRNSRFDILGSNEAIYVGAVKKVQIENNTITANAMIANWRGIIKINDYGQSQNQTKVPEALIRGNTITSNIPAKGISTKDAGLGAEPYRIENNSLYKAKLELREEDIVSNNREL